MPIVEFQLSENKSCLLPDKSELNSPCVVVIFNWMPEIGEYNTNMCVVVFLPIHMKGFVAIKTSAKL